MINRFISEHPWANTVLQLVVVVFSALCFGVALNMFLIPGNIYSSGVTGIAQLITHFTNQTAYGHILTTGNLFFLLNIPLLNEFYKENGWFKLGASPFLDQFFLRGILIWELLGFAGFCGIKGEQWRAAKIS